MGEGVRECNGEAVALDRNRQLLKCFVIARDRRLLVINKAPGYCSNVGNLYVGWIYKWRIYIWILGS